MATLRALALVCGIAFRVSKVQTLLALSEAAGRALNGLNPLFFGLFATGAITGNRPQIAIAIGGLLLNTALGSALQMIGTRARLKQQTYVGFEFFRRFSILMATIETLDHQEDPELLDNAQMFRAWSLTVGSAVAAMLNLLNTLAFSVATLAVAFAANWRLLILALLGIPRLLLIKRSMAWDRAAEVSGSPHRRLADKLVDLSRDSDAGAESRVFLLRTTLIARVSAAAKSWQRAEVARDSKQAALDLVNGLLYFSSAAAIIGWMCLDAVHGRLSVAALTIAVTSLGALQGISVSIVSSAKWVGQAARSAVRFVWLCDYAAEVHAQNTGDQQPGGRLRSGIKLKGVRYRHRGADRDAICDLDLTLPAGSVIAVVGENGAGKSTLVKLLTGMYRPTGGQIMVDDVDLADLDLTAWREQTAGAFQDHAKLEFKALTTVGLGDLHRNFDRVQVRRALDDAWATDVLAALPEELETQLGPRWSGGVDLSGGQWQRLAIARGMMRQQPLLLVLDEPTSALDAATEHALFDRYAGAARRLRDRNGVTLLITHRFSTTAAADFVVVLKDGQLIEHGTHEELMATGGIYSELYDIQARGYR